MRTHRKCPEGTANSEQGNEKFVQPNNTTGFETCQDIQAIKAELARLDGIMKTTGSADGYSRSAVRYWAIRWVMGWEKEIPE